MSAQERGDEQGCEELERNLNYRMQSVFENQTKPNPGAAETAQQLRALVLAQDLGLVPRTYMVARNYL